MELEQARALADELVVDFTPCCERIEIAGSIRRKSPWVKDIEIVAIPRFYKNLFGDPLTLGLTELDEVLLAWLRLGYLVSLKNGPRFKQFRVKDAINLDLFLVFPPAQWGVILAIRTGPAQFSQWLVTSRSLGGALPSHYKVKDGAVWEGLDFIPTPEEQDFFDVLGLEWLSPHTRRPHWSRRTPVP